MLSTTLSNISSVLPLFQYNDRPSTLLVCHGKKHAQPKLFSNDNVVTIDIDEDADPDILGHFDRMTFKDCCIYDKVVIMFCPLQVYLVPLKGKVGDWEDYPTFEDYGIAHEKGFRKAKPKKKAFANINHLLKRGGLLYLPEFRIRIKDVEKLGFEYLYDEVANEYEDVFRVFRKL